ncbi:MAG: hypothetical protein Q3976_03010 [Corynebacterium sp.]|nr:hypothetical protein [Corynebacterium sp.]
MSAQKRSGLLRPLDFAAPYRQRTQHAHGLQLLDWFWACIISGVASILRFLGIAVATSFAKVGEALQAWDGHVYLDIAATGYFSATAGGAADPTTYEHRLAFFPGLPLSIRGISAITGWSLEASGLVLVHVCAIIAIAGIIQLARLLGASTSTSLMVAVVVASAPMAITMSMVYTEAPFVMAMVWFLITLSQGKHLPATCWLVTAGFLRLTAIDLVLALVLAIVVLCPRDWRSWLVALIGSMPLVGYVLWASYYTRDAGGYFGIQAQGWHSSFDFGQATFAWLLKTLREPVIFGYVLSSFAIILIVALMLIAWRGLPLLWWLSAAGITANVVLSDGIMHSRPRLLLPALVIFLIPLVLRCAERWKTGRTWQRWGIALVGVGWVALGLGSSIYMVTAFPYAI